MANVIEPAVGLKNTNFVAPTSRYVSSPIVYYHKGEDKVITFESYKRRPKVFSEADRLMVISKGQEFRPDRIAQTAYGRTLAAYWWKIMEANDIFDVFDLKAGRTLRIPPVTI